MAATRVRKAFRYPEGDDDNEPEELDEEHQEQLIENLHKQDAERNGFYQKAFLPLPVLGAAFYVFTFFTSTTARQRLLALLSMSSLSATAYLLYYQPPKVPDRKGKKPVYLADAESGPIEKYLIYLNASLASVLALAAVVSWSNGMTADAWRQAMPGLIFAIIMFARHQMVPLELHELKRARYELKGA